MALTISWNGGQNAVMLSPSIKIWLAIFAIFTIGIIGLGLAGLALVGGAAFLLWQIALLALHALSAAIYSSIFTFILSLLLSAFLLILLIALSMRIFDIHLFKGRIAA